MSSDYSNISQFFSHPLVLLLIGALISGILIPYFTNRAVKYQKGLEIKTDLVGQINERVMQIVTLLNTFAVELDVAMVSKMDGSSGLYSRKSHLQNEADKIKKQLDQDELEESTRTMLDGEQKLVSRQLEEIAKSIQKIEDLDAEVEKELRRWDVSSAVIGSQILIFLNLEKRPKKN